MARDGVDDAQPVTSSMHQRVSKKLALDV